MPVAAARLPVSPPSTDKDCVADSKTHDDWSAPQCIATSTTSATARGIAAATTATALRGDFVRLHTTVTRHAATRSTPLATAVAVVGRRVVDYLSKTLVAWAGV